MNSQPVFRRSKSGRCLEREYAQQLLESAPK